MHRVDVDDLSNDLIGVVVIVDELLVDGELFDLVDLVDAARRPRRLDVDLEDARAVAVELGAHRLDLLVNAERAHWKTWIVAVLLFAVRWLCRRRWRERLGLDEAFTDRVA